MILVDIGPLVALFDPADGSHARCVRLLQSVDEPLATTIPVLTEAFHLLMPGSTGAQRLMDFVSEASLTVWSFDDGLLSRCFELMIQYADRPMDLADASLVALAEPERLNRVLTTARDDFATYRIKRGHRHLPSRGRRLSSSCALWSVLDGKEALIRFQLSALRLVAHSRREQLR